MTISGLYGRTKLENRKGLDPTVEKNKDASMIDLFLKYATDPAMTPELDTAMAELMRTSGQGRADLVETAERRSPQKTYRFRFFFKISLRAGTRFLRSSDDTGFTDSSTGTLTALPASKSFVTFR